MRGAAQRGCDLAAGHWDEVVETHLYLQSFKLSTRSRSHATARSHAWADFLACLWTVPTTHQGLSPGSYPGDGDGRTAMEGKRRREASWNKSIAVIRRQSTYLDSLGHRCGWWRSPSVISPVSAPIGVGWHRIVPILNSRSGRLR